MSLRIGLLGAAGVTPMALIQPARQLGDVSVAAIAARDPVRAGRFAARHGIAKVHTTYEALLADREIEAVYNPLPNGLHGRWTIAALEAGKHVLCEKPFTANAAEAEAVAAVARRTGLVAMEAFHYRYHALTKRMLAILESGELGAVQRIEAAFCIPLPGENIRWDIGLAGGSLMDVGSYAVHLLRTLAGAEPEVRSATAKERTPGIDRLLQAELQFADGRTGAISAAMWAAQPLGSRVRVIGTEGVMDVNNPILPHFFHSLKVELGGKRRTEHVPKQPSSYAAQLQVFAGAVLRGEPVLTDVSDAIANMRVIDACYRAAGLPLREPTRAR
jgi:predicted dehydrogenase